MKDFNTSMPNNVGNLGKIIVATSFEWLPKVQKIAQSGHTELKLRYPSLDLKTLDELEISNSIPFH